MSKKKGCSCGVACGIDINKEKQEYEDNKNLEKENEQIIDKVNAKECSCNNLVNVKLVIATIKKI